MNIAADSVFALASQIELRIRSDGFVTITVGGERLTLRHHVLAVLDLFRVPRRFDAALDELGRRASGASNWMELTATIQQLVDAGVLRDPTSSQTTVVRPRSFERPSQHICMLDDRARTDAFLNALHETVKPNDVVLDIGTGTGVLAVGAARAGARRVYAIEAGAAMADVARRIVEANGFTDRVEVLHGWSTQLELPERATVVVSETIGSDALEEEILTTFWDARRRLATNDARFLPRKIRLSAVAVEVPSELWQAEIFTREKIERWKSWYSTDFAALQDVETSVRIMVARNDARSWARVSDPIQLGEIDLATAGLDVHFAQMGVAIDPCERAALLMFFELPLTPSILFSQDPLEETDAEDWPCPVWVTPRNTSLARGARFRVTFRRTHASHLSLERC